MVTRSGLARSCPLRLAPRTAKLGLTIAAAGPAGNGVSGSARHGSVADVPFDYATATPESVAAEADRAIAEADAIVAAAVAPGARALRRRARCCRSTTPAA